MPIDKVDINLLYLSKKRLAFEFIIFHSKAVAFVNIALFYDGAAFSYLSVLSYDFFLGAYPFACCDCSIASCVWSKANFSKYARYSIFLPAASYDSAMCAYDSDFGWDCVCDTKVSV